MIRVYEHSHKENIHGEKKYSLWLNFVDASGCDPETGRGWRHEWTRPSCAPQLTIQQHRMKPDRSKYSNSNLERDLSLTGANLGGLCADVADPQHDNVILAKADPQGTQVSIITSHTGPCDRELLPWKLYLTRTRSFIAT
ncbi:uncharacterized [Tachysurus ichikawai]